MQEVLCIELENQKNFGGVKYVFIDGGMTDNIRPALYQAEYEAVIANKLDEIEDEICNSSRKML